MNFCIYSDVCARTLSLFREAIADEKEEVCFEICSAGGDLFPALGMIDLVRMRGLKSSCRIYGWAASAAAIIALSCGHVTMTSNGSLLVHSVWSPEGEIEDTTRDYINERQLNIINRRDPSFTMKDLVAEQWQDADACKAHGFADEIIAFSTIANPRLEKLVAMARPFNSLQEGKMEKTTVKAECGEERKEEQVQAAEEGEATRPADELADIVEKILQRLEEMDHRIAVLEGEGKKEDDEMDSTDIVASARIHKIWQDHCNVVVATKDLSTSESKQIADLKRARAALNLKNFLK